MPSRFGLSLRPPSGMGIVGPFWRVLMSSVIPILQITNQKSIIANTYVSKRKIKNWIFDIDDQFNKYLNLLVISNYLLVFAV
jgi:hypothetical protein